MLNTYLEIAEALRRLAPDILWIDLDQGQLQALLNEDDEYDINIPAVPCAFIAIPDETWDQAGNKSQVGVGQLVITLLLQLPSTLHADDPLISLSVERLGMANEVHEIMLSIKDVLQRTKTRRMPVRHLYAVQQYYDLKVQYIRPVKHTPKPPPMVIGTFTFPIGQS